MKCLTKKTYIINRNFIYQEKSSRNTEINTSEYEGLTISELKNAKRKIIIDNFDIDKIPDKKILILGKKIKAIESQIRKLKLKKLAEEIDVKRLKNAAPKFLEVQKYLIIALKNTSLYKRYSIILTEKKKENTFKNISRKIKYLQHDFHSTRDIALPTLEALPKTLQKILKRSNTPKFLINKIINQTIEQFKLGKGKNIYKNLVTLEREVKITKK